MPGNLEAFEKLFKSFYAPLVAYANRYVSDVETAREIVQDFFVRFYEKKNTLSIDVSVKSYLYRSVYNCCINYLNQKNIQERHLKNIQMEKSDEENLEDEINSVELQHRIYEIIDDLPSQCRKIFKMNRFEGLKNDEIAAKLNLSKRTIETQISKALKVLRKKLTNYISDFQNIHED
ncbi:MAG TPA: RNA polymerase sigma-70 factor [Bacteroidales bacterium]|nr:RNA polymerase sigma-70 factor [Bacteroidales bacterium]